jgi:molybdopterin converting factor small subunit
MIVRVLWFGRLAEAGGGPSVDLDLPAAATADAVLAAAARHVPDCAGLLARSRVAMDHTFLDPTAMIRSNAEIAIIPPVSGG